jgi:Glycosyl transferases group 1
VGAWDAMGTVVFLGNSDDEERERRGYAAALRRAGWSVRWFSGAGDAIFLDLVGRVEQPTIVVHPDVATPIPVAIASVPCPTVSFQIDTFTYPSVRLARSLLFDYVACFHPDWDRKFRDAGHPGAFLLPHASDPVTECAAARVWEVAWVGRLSGPHYGSRRAILPGLRHQFQMNPWWERSYREDEVRGVYTRAYCALNISREDYPQDANLRVFEAMGAGALLITRVPTELTDYGFIDGQHFAGYRSANDIQSLIRSLLDEPARLESIARAGQDLVASLHTYDVRVQSLLDRVERGDARAPARSWSVHRIAALLLEETVRGRRWRELRSRGPWLARTAGVSALLAPARIFRDRLRKDPLS